MLTLLGALLGLIGSVLPQWFKLQQDKNDHAHELEMYRLTMEAQKFEHEYKLQEINANADIAESAALYKASEIKLTGWKIVDGLVALYNYSVRPTLTYAFFLVYFAAKIGQYMFLAQTTYPTDPVSYTTFWGTIWKLYSPEDMALFATIIAYWFGQRGMRYAMDRIAGPTTSQALNWRSSPTVNPTSPSTSAPVGGNVNVSEAIRTGSEFK